MESRSKFDPRQSATKLLREARSGGLGDIGAWLR